VHGGWHAQPLVPIDWPGPQAGPLAAVSEQFGPLLQPDPPTMLEQPDPKLVALHKLVGRQILQDG
jgi:hypothetical protein